MFPRHVLAAYLTILALASPPAARGGGDDVKPLLRETGKLSDDDPRDKFVTKSAHKVHKVKLEAGKTYRIEMTSEEVDPFLRLENALGRQLARDDDGAGYPNARIIFRADEDATYRVIATCFPQAMNSFKVTGSYQLTVSPATPLDVLHWRVQHLPVAKADERKTTLDELVEHLGKTAAKLSIQDVQLALSAAQAVEERSPKQAAAFYKLCGDIFATASEPKVTGIAKMFEGSARRVLLPGKTMAVKGTTLEGKPFDLAALKGKVVLVDFWATWCGPCIAEMPNMQKLYAAYKERGFEIIGISVDSDREKLDSFLQRRKLPWPMIHDDPDAGRATLAEYYGAISIPLPILVDRDGRVVSLNARGSELTQLLEKHLGPLEP